MPVKRISKNQTGDEYLFKFKLHTMTINRVYSNQYTLVIEVPKNPTPFYIIVGAVSQKSLVL